MPCVPLTRLAVALPLSDALDQQVRAAEQAQLDLVTLGVGRAELLHRAVALAAATSRIGVVAELSAAPEAPEAAADPAIAQRIGLLDPDLDPDLEPALGPAWLVARTSVPADGPALPSGDAELIFVAARSPAEAAERVAQLRRARTAGGTRGALRIFADLAIAGEASASASDSGHPGPLPVISGPPPALAAGLGPWRAAGFDGFRLHPVGLEQDLRLILEGLVPFLRENDAFRRGYETRTLRGHLGLPTAAIMSPAAPVG